MQAPESQRAILPYEILHLATHFASKDDYRPALSGVHVDPKRKMCDAADGFVCASVPIVELDSDFPMSEEIIIPRTVLMRVKRIAKKGESISLNREHDEFWTLGIEDVEFSFKPTDEAFPKIEGLYESARATPVTESIALGAAYLQRIAKLAQITTADFSIPYVKLTTHGPTQGVEFRLSSSIEGEGIEGLVDGSGKGLLMTMMVSK